jgi:unsaturated rhamnogalacturonyl hydrolase
MSRLSRRSVLGAMAALPLLRTAASAASATDWSLEVVKSTTSRFTPSSIGGWSYPVGLYLYGQYLVFKRTGTQAYLDYIRTWMDRFVDGSGNISQSFNSLDSMRCMQLLPILSRETGQARYKTAADKLRKRFPGYPRTSDGGMFHATSKVGQLWGDGVFMAQPFIADYAATYNDPYGFDESTKNMAVYFSHLKADNGLIFHAYDEDGSEAWASGAGHHSKFHWGRAIGWFGMAAIDILEVLPANHPRRQNLVDIVKHLATGYARFQDPATGRWWQVVDKGTTKGNWLETSCSAMYTFMLSRGVERGYLDPSYQAVAAKGYQGVLAKISLGSDKKTNLTDICEGTNVGDLNYYLGRARKTNDFHGLGAFLIMNEQLAQAEA